MIQQIHEEIWAVIPQFPNYKISSCGRIYNIRQDMIMSLGPNNHGHMKVALMTEDGHRYTRSVAHLVGKAFVLPPTPLCNQVVLLDGNLNNIVVENIVWRPAWFAWKYIRQLKTDQPNHYRNLKVMNLNTGVEYDSIIEAGMVEGLLFAEIWRSTYTHAKIFPGDLVFEVTRESMGSH